MFLLKDTTPWRRWGSNPRPSVSSQALYHWATAFPLEMGFLDAVSAGSEKVKKKWRKKKVICPIFAEQVC